METQAQSQNNGQTKQVVNPLDIRVAIFHIKGKTPLVMHRFSEKAAKQIEAKQQGKANTKTGKKARKPKEEFEGAKYIFEDGKTEGIRAVSFKKAMVRAAKQFPNLTMADAKGFFHVLAAEGDLLPIKGKSQMRTDAVRLSSGVSDMRYRPEYKEWEIDVPIEYNTNVINQETLLNLLMTAGFSCGVGEMRPERGDSFGRFDVTGVTSEDTE